MKKSKRGGRAKTAKASPKKAATPGMRFDAFHNLIRFPLTQADRLSRIMFPLQGDPEGLGLVDLIWGFPRLVGRFCSHLLPKQDGGTFQI